MPTAKNEQYQGPERRERSVLKKLKKVNKKKKRDTDDHTSRANILFLELEEALSTFNSVKNTNVLINDIQNPTELMGNFMFTRDRPTIIADSVDILYQTSEGDGIGFIPKSMYASPFVEEGDDIFNKFTAVVVPKTIVGDKVKIKLNMHHQFYSEAVLLQVLNSNSRSTPRKDNLVVCQKFEECSGCQFQMLSYDKQLQLKRDTIVKAYRFFYPELLGELDQSEFGKVIGCENQYAYRTKLTPHYKVPRVIKNETLSIGLNHVNPTMQVVDLESCAIATPSINRALTITRKKIKEEVKNAPLEAQGRQRTILLRDGLRMNKETGEHTRACYGESSKVMTEKVEDFVFQFDPSSFFQNNNSILIPVLEYIKYHIGLGAKSYKYLVDTYCGVGFFGISLSKSIPKEGKVFGIELSERSINFATHNAMLNGLEVPKRMQFISGSADSMFKNEEFLNSGIKGKESIVIMDPSRKGSTESFMRQLLEFKPKLIIYVSCNVFTQARDLSLFNKLQEEGSISYRVRDVVGFDFFPQTKHVETVAVLELLD
ncbi:hypothetical protein G9P44_006170 [Scheffersomyces stipitis]|nr:hypothetical protein G9P44_006170 [Scheffersomyces stipitis]